MDGHAPSAYMGLAVIGGSGAYELELENIGGRVDEIDIATPFGTVEGIALLKVEGADGPLAFVSRHGREGYRTGAWDVEYRAVIYALKEIGTTRIMAWSGPGAVDTRFEPGDYVLPSDLLDLTRHRHDTFFRGTGLGFIRQNPVFCPHLREHLKAVLEGGEVTLHDGGVYAVTEGPRLETAAEVRAIGRLGGDLVGMTLAPEAFLARELEMCYHPVCYVTNWAEGVRELPYKAGELFEGMLEESYKQRVDRAVQGFAAVVAGLAARIRPGEDRDCPCSRAMLRYRRRGQIAEDWRDWIGRG